MSTPAKIVQVQRYGGPEVLEWVDVLVPPPGPGEVTIRQTVVGLNFIDIYFRTGLYQQPLPHGLGYEAAGEVIAVGPGVTRLALGDRVAYGQSALGAYASARNLPADRLVKLPDTISDEQAAALMLKGLTVQYLFRQTYRLQAGQTVLFHAAAGGVGLLACQWARALGVKLIGTASSAEKAARALAAGAWQVIDTSREDIVERVLALTDGQKVPVVYDGVGQATWEASLDCLAPRGLMVSFGNASGPVTGVNLGILAAKGSLFVTRPTLATHIATPEALQAAADDLFALVRDGQLTAQISARYPLTQVGQAQEALASRATTGATILYL